MGTFVDFDHLFQVDPEGGNVGPNITRIPLATAQGSSVEGMWSTYMKTFEEYDKRISNAWKKDATGLLVFVSNNLHTSLSVSVTRW